MKFSISFLILYIILCVFINVNNAQDIPIVPTHSFRPPYSTGRAGIRHWNYNGDVTVYQDFIRLTQDQPSKNGYIWNRNPVSINDWEATISFRIDGHGRLGGDGIAFWYSSKPNILGRAFGSIEQWKGLGVFLDTFDNDNKHDNPYISVIMNDGNRIYNPATDGKDMEIGGCRAAIRRTNGLCYLRVSYRGSVKTLDVQFSINGNNNWRSCYSGQVDLPTGYYLGVSAATGGVSDNQDVYSFEFRRLDGGNPNVRPSRPEPVPRTEDENVEEKEEAVDTTDKQKEQDEITKKLKDELNELKKTEKLNNNNKKTKDVPPTDNAGRISGVEEELSTIESKLKLIAKVSEGVKAISDSIDQLKKEIDGKKSSSFDIAQFRNHLTKQQQELNRIASKSQETITNRFSERVTELQKIIDNLADRVDKVSLELKNKSGGFTTVFMIIIMLGEIGLLVFMYMNGRHVNKYDKMW